MAEGPREQSGPAGSWVIVGASSMRKFQYVALDSEGQKQNGTVEAASQDDAAIKVHMMGLEVVEISPANNPGPWVPLQGPVTLPAADPAPPRQEAIISTDRPAPSARPRAAGPRTGTLSLLMSSAALLLAVAALGAVLFRGDPLGPGLRKYDFHSPKSALQSVIRMRIDNNYRA